MNIYVLHVFLRMSALALLVLFYTDIVTPAPCESRLGDHFLCFGFMCRVSLNCKINK